MKLKDLKKWGFDNSYWVEKGVYKVSCSQCEALAINGLPSHEHGCPNQKHECKGCSNIINYPGYCSDCR